MFKDTQSDAVDSFKQLREQNTIELRRQNRQQIISKRRNIIPNEVIQNEVIYLQQHEVLDERYRPDIQNFLRWNFVIEDFNTLLQSINDSDILKQHYGLIGIRKILSIVDKPPIQPVIDAGLVPRLIEYVQQTEYPQLQLEATWALTNIAAGTTVQCQSIIDKGGIPLFVQLVKSSKPSIVEQAIWAIGNIASDCVYYRDTIIRAGGLVNLLDVVQRSEEEMIIKHGCWAFSNLARGNPLPKYEIIRPAILLMCNLIAKYKLKDREIITDCLWAISYNGSGQLQRIREIMNTGIIVLIVQYINQSQGSVHVPCVRIIGNLSVGTHTEVDFLLSLDVLTPLQKLLDDKKKILRKEVCWVISNIAAGNQEHVQILLSRQSLILRLFSLFQTDANEVKKQICYIFANFSYAANLSYLYQFYKKNSIVRYYVNLLTVEDKKTIEVSLECLYLVLSFGQKVKGTEKNPFVVNLYQYGAIDLLEKLQQHEDTKIYERVSKILTTFFDLVDPLAL